MNSLVQIHSLLRWVVLLTAFYAIFKALTGMLGNKSYGDSDAKAGLFLTISADIQLLIGIALYFFGGVGFKNIQANGMAFVMKDAFARFFAVEHILMMLIAIALFHVGKSKSRSAVADTTKHKMAFWYYLIGLIIILASIPWPFRKGFEAMGWM
jgi:hypothetical protein